VSHHLEEPCSVEELEESEDICLERCLLEAFYNKAGCLHRKLEPFAAREGWLKVSEIKRFLINEN